VEEALARIKGSAVLGVVKALRSLGKAKAHELLPQRLHKYLYDRILPSSWYPEADCLVLMRTLAQILESSQQDLGGNVYTLMGRVSAQNGLEGAYAHLVSPDPEFMLKRAAALWQAYHDTGKLEVSLEGPHKARLELSNFAQPSVEQCLIVVGWYSELFKACGAHDVSMVETQCRNRGARSCVWTVEWK
jgi:uncharacterized protein (TIGR02265 family)